MSKRSFTLTMVEDVNHKLKGKSHLGGRFISATPSSAARKAFSRVCRESKIKGQCTLNIEITETTQGSPKKSFTYKIKRIHDPKTVERNGEQITYEYRTVVKAL
jgi:hypothetical protein